MIAPDQAAELRRAAELLDASFVSPRIFALLVLGRDDVAREELPYPKEEPWCPTSR